MLKDQLIVYPQQQIRQKMKVYYPTYHTGSSRVGLYYIRHDDLLDLVKTNSDQDSSSSGNSKCYSHRSTSTSPSQFRVNRPLNIRGQFGFFDSKHDEKHNIQTKEVKEHIHENCPHLHPPKLGYIWAKRRFSRLKPDYLPKRCEKKTEIPSKCKALIPYILPKSYTEESISSRPRI